MKTVAAKPKPPKPPKSQTPQTKETPFTKGFRARLSQTMPSIVSVRWIDACITTGIHLDVSPGWEQSWTRKGIIMHTVGFLLQQTDDWVVVAMEGNGETGNGFREVQSIPRYSICEMVTLVDGKQNKNAGWVDEPKKQKT